MFKLKQGNYVAIKQLLKSSVQLTRELLVELKEVSELQHQNVNSFVGACVDSPNICILTQYCNKGSLQDVLFNDDLKLDWMFQVSIASDIARVSFIIIFRSQVVTLSYALQNNTHFYFLYSYMGYLATQNSEISGLRMRINAILDGQYAVSGYIIQ